MGFVHLIFYKVIILILSFQKYYQQESNIYYTCSTYESKEVENCIKCLNFPPFNFIINKCFNIQETKRRKLSEKEIKILKYKDILKNIELIIFNLDDTLVYTFDLWNNVGSDYLVSKEITPPDNLLKIINKMSLREMGEYFIKELKLNKTIDLLESR